MLWAAKCETKCEEDAAYSLLGIFNIYMPLIYGKGREKALIWLREIKESLKDELEDELEDLPSNPFSNIPFLYDLNYINRRSPLDQIYEKLSMLVSKRRLLALAE